MMLILLSTHDGIEALDAMALISVPPEPPVSVNPFKSRILWKLPVQYFYKKRLLPLTIRSIHDTFLLQYFL